MKTPAPITTLIREGVEQRVALALGGEEAHEERSEGGPVQGDPPPASGFSLEIVRHVSWHRRRVGPNAGGRRAGRLYRMIGISAHRPARVHEGVEPSDDGADRTGLSVETGPSGIAKPHRTWFI
jgi:hypothetical protein